jgi:hypothetical protein
MKSAAASSLPAAIAYCISQNLHFLSQQLQRASSVSAHTHHARIIGMYENGGVKRVMRRGGELKLYFSYFSLERRGRARMTKVVSERVWKVQPQFCVPYWHDDGWRRKHLFEWMTLLDTNTTSRRCCLSLLFLFVMIQRSVTFRPLFADISAKFECWMGEGWKRQTKTREVVIIVPSRNAAPTQQWVAFFGNPLCFPEKVPFPAYCLCSFVRRATIRRNSPHSPTTNNPSESAGQFREECHERKGRNKLRHKLFLSMDFRSVQSFFYFSLHVAPRFTLPVCGLLASATFVTHPIRLPLFYHQFYRAPDFDETILLKIEYCLLAGDFTICFLCRK